MVYPGGKSGSGAYQTIINNIPPHDIYIEPFLGGGAIMRIKKPAPVMSFGIDADEEAINNFVFPWSAPHELIIGSAFDWLPLFCCKPNQGRTMVYIDPPYLKSVRRSARDIYRFELDDSQHEQLLDICLSLNCLVMLSGYDSDMYNRRLSNWRRAEFDAITRAGTVAREVLWMNYPAPNELHDYRFVGENYRERERIKKMVKRWKNRLSKMDVLQRAALLQALEK